MKSKSQAIELIDRIACLVNRAVQVFPLSCYFDIGLVHTLADAHRPLASAKDKGQDRQDLQCPAVYGCVIHKDAALLAIIA